MVILASFTLPLVARGACPPSCAARGRSGRDRLPGRVRGQRHPAQLQAVRSRAPEPRKELRCFDGDVGCEPTASRTTGACSTWTCVCERRIRPDPVHAGRRDGRHRERRTTRSRAGARSRPRSAALVPATTNVCTTGRTLAVPLKGPDARGRFKLAKKKVGSGDDGERARCRHAQAHLPAARMAVARLRSPEHAGDAARDGARRGECGVARAEVEPGPADGDRHATTASSATPAVGFGNVYIGSWNGFVVAAKRTTGALKWTYDTQSQGVGARARRLGLGDAHGRRPRARRRRNAVLHCLNAKNGKLLWKTPLGDSGRRQIWALADRRREPGLHRHRVALGQSVHKRPLDGARPRHGHDPVDAPEHSRPGLHDGHGRRLHVDGECPNGGTCVPGRGAGVTATVSTDETGEFVYMNTRRLLHIPVDRRLGLDLQARRGDRRDVWKTRVQPPEQFNACAGDQSSTAAAPPTAHSSAGRATRRRSTTTSAS